MFFKILSWAFCIYIGLWLALLAITESFRALFYLRLMSIVPRTIYSTGVCSHIDISPFVGIYLYGATLTSRNIKTIGLRRLYTKLSAIYAELINGRPETRDVFHTRKRLARAAQPNPRGEELATREKVHWRDWAENYLSFYETNRYASRATMSTDMMVRLNLENYLRSVDCALKGFEGQLLRLRMLAGRGKEGKAYRRQYVSALKRFKDLLDLAEKPLLGLPLTKLLDAVCRSVSRVNGAQPCSLNTNAPESKAFLEKLQDTLDQRQVIWLLTVSAIAEEGVLGHTKGAGETNWSNINHNRLSERAGNQTSYILNERTSSGLRNNVRIDTI